MGQLVDRARDEDGRQAYLCSKEEMSIHIEPAIGRDLQFIRINGIVVRWLAARC